MRNMVCEHDTLCRIQSVGVRGLRERIAVWIRIKELRFGALGGIGVDDLMAEEQSLSLKY